MCYRKCDWEINKDKQKRLPNSFWKNREGADVCIKLFWKK